MPDKPLTIATYAAGASLAAITLVYVFAPTFFIDGESGGMSSRKKGVVGLHNPANDCFINSVLQALAGLGDLRIYLIRETHRRKLDGSEVYAEIVEDPARKGLPAWKIVGLQEGLVTAGLKDILDALNERPLYKKTISAVPFIGILEAAFKQRISRQQQDAQELLQVVAERLCDEYHAGHRARAFAKKARAASILSDSPTVDKVGKDFGSMALEDERSDSAKASVEMLETVRPPASVRSERRQANKFELEDEDGFPLEGGSESQIECLTCGFKPKATESTFCSLTLSVPQVSSTSLSTCFDDMFKTEYIEDFKCDKCRLTHALETFQQELARSTSDKFKQTTQNAIDKLKVAIETNPEDKPKDVELPDTKFAPKRKIAKHVRITKFPKVMAIHLSRSIFGAGMSTMKNSAKVSFPEHLPLGGLLEQRQYKLLSVVCHKGSHHSGHYESFRRQNIHPPFSTPNTFHPSLVYSKPPSPSSSHLSTPQLGAVTEDVQVNSVSSAPAMLSAASAASTDSLPYTNGRRSVDSHPNSNGRPLSSITSSSTCTDTTPTSAPAPSATPRDSDGSSVRSMARSARDTLSKIPSSLSRSSPSKISSPEGSAHTLTNGIPRAKRKKRTTDRWWRISDEKIKESKTSDVLGMQKEVYMLFYELQKGNEETG